MVVFCIDRCFSVVLKVKIMISGVNIIIYFSGEVYSVVLNLVRYFVVFRW